MAKALDKALEIFQKCADDVGPDRRKVWCDDFKFRDCFANREVGVILCEQGRLKEAAQRLGGSLESAGQTSKAMYHLREATSGLIEQGECYPGFKEPTITIAVTSDNPYTDRKNTMLEITVLDENADNDRAVPCVLDGIWANDKPLLLQIGEKKYSTRLLVRLLESIAGCKS